ncbi:YggS family pyridoxal phosphate-dependent enzyme [Fusibacter paucivorans]|uniref:Pyridoxal phosphate homeostasis protein n=1 Tax=Fusibacter paucivorans TaxID=76009 RepID=A0ABS5PR53_9FIRM|nr:YggS family pyridoxal phosphate-dependent enzyme [Fusibacter paucivorans]MBS7527397.1 YggS family pyridoxal phosphate-dependent enzyme [Fusibacter paucivorans]
MTYAYLKTNIQQIRKAIDSVKRPWTHPVTLIGVTKTYEADIINESIAYGIQAIGENKVQEIMRKYDAVAEGVAWHLIGHLQTNKVKYIIDKVDLIQSVDSEKLAMEIEKRAAAIHKIQDILIQINVAGEDQKAGIAPEDLPALLELISKLPHIRVQGLMNIGLFTDDEALLRSHFKKMRMLFETLPDYGYSNVTATHLSMGMSGDFELAIEEGATMVRVGTSIYGKRNYS